MRVYIQQNQQLKMCLLLLRGCKLVGMCHVLWLGLLMCDGCCCVRHYGYVVCVCNVLCVFFYCVVMWVRCVRMVLFMCVLRICVLVWFCVFRILLRYCLVCVLWMSGGLLYCVLCV